MFGCEPSLLAVTVISIEEQLSGWYTALRRARRPRDLARIYDHIAQTARFYGYLRVLSFSESAIAIYEDLRARKLNVSRMDLRIAAIALERDACVVTANTRDFGRVAGLKMEDWSAA